MEGRGSRPYRIVKADDIPKRQQQQAENENAEPEDLIKSSSVSSSAEQEPFMGVKARRRSSVNRLFKGDYIEVGSNDQILKLLNKQGDQVLFAENVLKVNSRGKFVRRILLITDVALYTLETQFFSLKRRIRLLSITKVYLSESNDNFFAIVVPDEYDVLFASARKTEIVTVLSDAHKKLRQNGENLEVSFQNKFEYYLDSVRVREVIIEQIEGGVKTRFVDK